MPKLPSSPPWTHFEHESIDVASSSWNIGTEPNLSFVPIITRRILEEDGVAGFHAERMACRSWSKRLAGLTEPEQALHLSRSELVVVGFALRRRAYHHELDERGPTGKWGGPEGCPRFINGGKYTMV